LHQSPTNETVLVSLNPLLDFSLKPDEPLPLVFVPGVAITYCIARDLNLSILVDPDFNLARSKLASLALVVVASFVVAGEFGEIGYSATEEVIRALT
jgi:hypothetical protein